jgi:hypothetical protein
MQITHAPLSMKVNILSMNYLNNYIYAFTNDGEFFEFEIDLDRK